MSPKNTLWDQFGIVWEIALGGKSYGGHNEINLKFEKVLGFLG